MNETCSECHNTLSDRLHQLGCSVAQAEENARWTKRQNAIAEIGKSNAPLVFDLLTERVRAYET
jgi:hypothetical protein